MRLCLGVFNLWGCVQALGGQFTGGSLSRPGCGPAACSRHTGRHGILPEDAHHELLLQVLPHCLPSAPEGKGEAYKIWT